MAIEAGDWARLAEALERLRVALDETTDPVDGGGRRVAGVGAAVMLSEAASSVEPLLVEFTTRLLREHGVPAASSPVRLAHSDSPDGPWEPVEFDGVRVVSVEGDAAEIVGALEAARRAVSFPVAQWNAMQARRPGADHQRFHAGELIDAAGVRGVERAAMIARRLAGSVASGEDGPVAPDEPVDPPITENESRVLQTMSRFDASQLLSAKRIADGMDLAERLSEETVRKCVRKLIDSGLAERPEGERSGARLTLPGRRLAGKIAD